MKPANLKQKRLSNTVLRLILFLAIIFGIMPNIQAQITIGSDSPPHEDALLDLKESDTGISTKGILLPRVALKSLTDSLTRAAGEKVELKGMLVYNTFADANLDLEEGCYYHNGIQWQKVGSGSSAEEERSDLWTAVSADWEIVDQRTVFYGKVANFVVEVKRKGAEINIWGAAVPVAKLPDAGTDDKYKPYAFMNCIVGFPNKSLSTAAEGEVTSTGLSMSNLRQSFGTIFNRSTIKPDDIIVFSGSYLTPTI